MFGYELGGLRAEALGRPRARLYRLNLAIARWRIGDERVDQLARRALTLSTARSKAAAFAFDGRVKPHSLRTNCSDDR